MASFSERRQTIRIAVNGNLNIESVGGGPSLRLIDVGMGGFAVKSLAPLALDVVTSYRFTAPDKKWTAIFRARAVHCKLVGADSNAVKHYLTGLTFVNIESPAVQRELMAMMDHAMTFVSFS